MAQLIALYAVGAVTAGVGVAITRGRVAVAKFYSDMLWDAASTKEAAARARARTTPRLVLVIGVWATLLGAVVIVLAVLASIGVLQLAPAK